MDRDARPTTLRTVEDVLKRLTADGKELRLYDFSELDNEGAKLVAQALPQCKSLEKLILFRCNIGPEGVKALAQGLPRCTALTTLDLGGNDIGPEGAEALAGVLPQCTALAELGLHDNDIGDEGAKTIADSVAQCNALGILNFIGNKIGVAGAQGIARVLPTLEVLKALYLSNNNIGDTGIQAIALALRKCIGVQVLFLEANSIGISGAQAIAELLPYCKNLRMLNLESNNLGVEGTKAIAAKLPNCLNLETLYLRGNKAGAKGTTDIAAAVLECKSLHTLFYEDNDIGAEGARVLAGAIPNCRALETFYVDSLDVSADPSPVYDAVPAELRRNFQNVVQFLLDARDKLKLQWHRRAKLIVLGNAGVGKTTLLDALIQPLAPVFVPATRQWLRLQGRYLNVYDVEPSSASMPVQSHDLENATVARANNGVHISSAATALDVSVPLANDDIAQAWYDYVRFHTKRTETLGIHTRSWEILSAVNNIPPTKLTVLDFAGQVEYYDSHIMFLSSRAIYLLLWSLADTSDQASTRLSFWCDSLRRHVVNSENVRDKVVPCPPVILIGTNADCPAIVNSFETDTDDRRATAFTLALDKIGAPTTKFAYFEVDARTMAGARMKELRAHLETCVREWPLLDQRIPRSYTLILDVIHRESSRVPPILDVKTLWVACRKTSELKDLRQETLYTALELFDAWGDCVYYGKHRRADLAVPRPNAGTAEPSATEATIETAAPPLLDRLTKHLQDDDRATVVLRPAWLMEDVYGPATLAAKAARGIILQRQIDASAHPNKLWKEWAPAIRKRAMDVLVEFGLCTQLKAPHMNAGDWFLPGALPEKPPADLPPFAAQPAAGELDIVRDLEWEFLTSSVFGALLIRFYTTREIVVLHSWRLGAFIKARPNNNNTAAGTVVRIDVHPQQPKMRIWARGPAPSAIFIIVLKAALSIAHNNHPRPLKLTQMLRCTVPGCKADVDIENHFREGPCKFDPNGVLAVAEADRARHLPCKNSTEHTLNDPNLTLTGIEEPALFSGTSPPILDRWTSYITGKWNDNRIMVYTILTIILLSGLLLLSPTFLSPTKPSVTGDRTDTPPTAAKPSADVSPITGDFKCLGSSSCGQPEPTDDGPHPLNVNQETPSQYLVWTWQNKRYDIFLSFRGSERYDLAATAGTVAEADTMRVRVIRPAYEQLLTSTYSVFYDDTALADAMSREPGGTLNDLVQGLLSTRGGGVVVAVVTKSYLTRTWPLIELAVAARLHLAKQLCLVILLLNVEPQEIAQHGFLQQHCPDIGSIPMRKLPPGLERSDAARLSEFIVSEARKYRGVDVTGATKGDSFHDLKTAITKRLKHDRDAQDILIGRLQTERQPNESLYAAMGHAKGLTHDNVEPLRQAFQKDLKGTEFSDLLDLVHRYETKWLDAWTQASDAISNLNIDIGTLTRDASAYATAHKTQ